MVTVSGFLPISMLFKVTGTDFAHKSIGATTRQMLLMLEMQQIMLLTISMNAKLASYVKFSQRLHWLTRQLGVCLLCGHTGEGSYTWRASLAGSLSCSNSGFRIRATNDLLILQEGSPELGKQHLVLILYSRLGMITHEERKQYQRISTQQGQSTGTC